MCAFKCGFAFPNSANMTGHLTIVKPGASTISDGIDCCEVTGHILGHAKT
jgi:hypothetical protein